MENVVRADVIPRAGGAGARRGRQRACTAPRPPPRAHFLTSSSIRCDIRPVNRNPSVPLAILALVFAATAPCRAQQRALTAADYARGERFLSPNVAGLTLHTSVQANWLPDERFWYRNSTGEQSEFILVDPARRTREPAFDHTRLAAALSTAAHADYDAAHLPFRSFVLSPDSRSISFSDGENRWKCDRQGNACAPDTSPAVPPAGRQRAGEARRSRGSPGAGALSPDGKSSIFIRDYNLWVRDVASGKETQLTTDGVQDFGYATDNAGWASSDRAIVVWSPDSRKVATFQQDQRGVGEMYLVNTTVGHPTLKAWKYPLPGDAVVTTIQRVIIDVAAAKVVRLRMPPDQHRSTGCDDIVCGGGVEDMQWDADGSKLAFVSTSRDHKVERLKIADASTGAVRDVLEERAATFFESGIERIN